MALKRKGRTNQAHPLGGGIGPLPVINLMRIHLLASFLPLVIVCGCAVPQRESGDTTAKPKESQMERVTGIGGVFFKVKDPKGMAAWYRTNLGIQSRNGYTQFSWRDKDHPEEMGRTVWAIFPTNTTYFGPSSSSLMINYRVSNLDRMLEQLRTSGVKIEKVEDTDYGRFAWITDREGNRIELWQPKGK